MTPPFCGNSLFRSLSFLSFLLGGGHAIIAAAHQALGALRRVEWRGRVGVSKSDEKKGSVVGVGGIASSGAAG